MEKDEAVISILLNEKFHDYLNTVVESAFTLGFAYRDQLPEVAAVYTQEQAIKNIQDTAWYALYEAHTSEKDKK